MWIKVFGVSSEVRLVGRECEGRNEKKAETPIC